MRKTFIGAFVLLFAACGLMAADLPLGLSVGTTFDDLLLGGYELTLQDDNLLGFGDLIFVEPPSGLDSPALEKSGQICAYFPFDGAPWIMFCYMAGPETSEADRARLDDRLKAELGEPLPAKSAMAFLRKYARASFDATIFLAQALFGQIGPESLARWIMGAIIAAQADMLEPETKPDLWITDDFYVARFANQTENHVACFNRKALRLVAEGLSQMVAKFAQSCSDAIIGEIMDEAF